MVIYETPLAKFNMAFNTFPDFTQLIDYIKLGLKVKHYTVLGIVISGGKVTIILELFRWLIFNPTSNFISVVAPFWVEVVYVITGFVIKADGMLVIVPAV